MMRRGFVVIGMLVLTLGLPGSTLAQAATATVSVEDEDFSPATVNVSAGTAVTWHNGGVEKHTITTDDGAYDSGALDPGQSYSITFDAPGTYAYYCTIHGGPNGDGMAGVVVVK